MDYLIKRQDAIDEIVTWTVEDRPDVEMPTDLIGRIKALPSAESEIIRCKDCCYWLPRNGLCGIWEWYISNDAFYCGYGERRTDERLNQQKGNTEKYRKDSAGRAEDG